MLQVLSGYQKQFAVFLLCIITQNAKYLKEKSLTFLSVIWELKETSVLKHPVKCPFETIAFRLISIHFPFMNISYYVSWK